jgi:3-oxoacyl-[acyl-carrier protein] reductase
LQTRLATVMKERGVDLATAEREFIRGSGITRIGEPEDIAGLAAFVLGPEGSYLHGALIDMDGGSTKTI